MSNSAGYSSSEKMGLKTSHPRMSFASLRPSSCNEPSFFSLHTSSHTKTGFLGPPDIGRTHRYTSVGQPHSAQICILCLLSLEHIKNKNPTSGGFLSEY